MQIKCAFWWVGLQDDCFQFLWLWQLSLVVMEGGIVGRMTGLCLQWILFIFFLHFGYGGEWGVVDGHVGCYMAGSGSEKIRSELASG
jgi:hypothetical protein